ncbi:MAG: chemotaxis protein CheW [Oscillospiraceae bacterium]|nr:chemotaxis protein CheW [Oscillospiraceae bacterium]
MEEMQNMAEAQLLETGEEDTMQNKYLVFLLDSQDFAIPIRHVVDIINVQPITRVPNTPEYVKGITNLRGKVIPIVDVLTRFGKQHMEYNERTCIIVVEYKGASVGMIIDSVSEVVGIDSDHISPPPTFSDSAEAKFIQGIGRTENSVRLILDFLAVLEDSMYMTDDSDSEEE